MGRLKPVCDDEALQLIAERADGDARRALTALEVAVLSQRKADKPPYMLRQPSPQNRSSKRLCRMTRRAIRTTTWPPLSSRACAAAIRTRPLYWLARMLEGGEDPRFIARRIAICASEDVGNADPQALVIAASAADVTNLVGLPECEYALAQATVYIACAPKSNAVTQAIHAAREDVREKPILPVPIHLRDRSYRGAGRLGHGDGYRSPHNFPAGYLDQDYLGALRKYYNPLERGDEIRLAALLRERRNMPNQTDDGDEPRDA